VTWPIRSVGQNLNYPVSLNEYIDHLRGFEEPGRITSTLPLHKMDAEFAGLCNVPNAGLPLTGDCKTCSVCNGEISKVEQIATHSILEYGMSRSTFAVNG
jgi:hypothetical protein